GVFVGLGGNDYGQMHPGLSDPGALSAWTLTGHSASMASGRISYLLGLKGPSLTVDTACSASLVSTHLAMRSLRAGECDLALSIGTSAMLSPVGHTMLCQMSALARDGRSKAFDARADGYGRGEGAGAVILKRLSDALRDGDFIYAVVRGSAVNQDGASSGLTAPNGPAQEAVIRAALSDARVRAEDISYVEAHG